MGACPLVNVPGIPAPGKLIPLNVKLALYRCGSVLHGRIMDSFEDKRVFPEN